MKKFLMIAVLAVAGLAQADDSWLYWMVSGNNTIGGEWAYAKVKVSGSDGASYLTLSDGYDTFASVQYEDVAKSAGHDFAIDSVAAQLGKYASSSYSYMIELYNDEDEMVATSDTLAYSAAAAYIGSEMSPSGDTWNASTWHIPEPSSGLLSLLGMSLLALRRRRLKA